MRTIQIGLIVHKAIEAERRSLAETEDEILSRLITGEEARPAPEPTPTGKHWAKDGVVLPEGTALRVQYSGQQVEGSVIDGAWRINGKSFNSPSMAMIHNVVTKDGRRTNINGWNHWEVRRPADRVFRKLSSLRS